MIWYVLPHSVAILLKLFEPPIIRYIVGYNIYIMNVDIVFG